MHFARPKALAPDDRVCVIAPSGPFDRESFEAGLKLLSSRYRVSFDEGIFSVHRYLAGDDSRRRTELEQALANPSVRAVFVARGGYGAMRLLPKLDLERLPHKLLVGFSDVTAIHGALQSVGRASIHAPVLTQLGRQPPDVVEQLFRLLESSEPREPLKGATPFVPGIAEGPLVGGNLSVLTRLLGTPFMPSFDGAILLLEDVGERPYRLDRMWTHLSLAGVFQRVRGIALGEFHGCEEQGQPYGSADVLRSLAEETNLPCAAGFRIGHGEVNEPVPLGVRARLDATSGTLEFLEPAVEHLP